MSTTSAIFDDFQLFRVIALILLVTGIATASFPVLIAAGIVTFGWPFLCVYLLKSAAGRKNRRENISFRLFDLVRRAASVLPIPSRIVR